MQMQNYDYKRISTKRSKSLSVVGRSLIFNPHRNKAISGFHWLNRQQQHMIIGLVLQSRNLPQSWNWVHVKRDVNRHLSQSVANGSQFKHRSSPRKHASYLEQINRRERWNNWSNTIWKKGLRSDWPPPISSEIKNVRFSVLQKTAGDKLVTLII